MFELMRLTDEEKARLTNGIVKDLTKDISWSDDDLVETDLDPSDNELYEQCLEVSDEDAV